MILILAAILTLSFVVVRCSQPTFQEKLSLTYLDQLKLSDLKEKPADSYADSIEVKDYTFYGPSLVLYDRSYSPLEKDGFYGRNVTLKNIQTGEQIRTSFTGGADGGIDLQSLPAGVYEVFIDDGYTPKRAFLEQSYRSEPLITMRDNKNVKSVELNANTDYLARFGVRSDRNYLYLTVTDSLPIVKVADVVLDPSGFVLDQNGNETESYSQDGFEEAAQSWQLAQMIKERLEAAGLRVVISRSEQEPLGYVGAKSRTAAAYNSQAKLFVSLAMSNMDVARPFVISSPFTNGRLGNDIVNALGQDGIEITAISNLPQLNAGNGYDSLMTDENYEYTRFELLPALRETGGKATSAGQAPGWNTNAPYGQNAGLAGVVVEYADMQNQDSRTYFLDHKEQFAQGIAQGIIEYCRITPLQTSQSSQN